MRYSAIQDSQLLPARLGAYPQGGVLLQILDKGEVTENDTLAYFDTKLIAGVKSFIVQTPGANLAKKASCCNVVRTVYL